MSHDDPLYRLRHAIAGVALALVLSVFTAALLGRWLGDAFDGGYGLRAALFGAFLLYVLAGAVVLFVRVAAHETRPLTAARVALWFASLWLWPGLMRRRRDGPH